MIIEKTIIDYLKACAINGIGDNVFAEVPLNPPQKYITVYKTGSDTENRLTTATVAIRSISKRSLYEAAEINEAMKTAMEGIIFSEPVYRAALQTDYNNTLTSTREYCYQALFLVTHE